jgi:hypothetical protein
MSDQAGDRRPERAPRQPSEDGTTLLPILVDSVGRGGTTLMMQLLGTSSEIAFDRTYPFEHRYFSYLLELSDVLTRSDWDHDLWPGNPTAALPRDHQLVGPVPWKDRRMIAPDDLPPIAERAFALLWREFSERARVRMRQLGFEGSARYYAEKYNGARRLLLRKDLPNLLVLPLLRDPRDTLVSAMAFDAKRAEGFLRFPPGEGVDQHLDRFFKVHRARLRWLASFDGPWFSYERLATDLPSEAARLEELLGVRLDPEEVERRRGEYKHHMTAATAAESVGRWKRELSPELIERFQAELGDELRALGYET